MIKQQYYRHRWIPSYALIYWRHVALTLCIASVILTTFRTTTWERCLPVDLTKYCSQVSIKHSIVNDPYLRPGTLLSRNGTDDSIIPFWDPFDPSLARPPHLLQTISERQPQPWLQNKTLLIIGDSVDRYLTQFFCELTYGNYRRANMTTLDSPTEHDDLTSKTSPVVCRLDYYDFEIVSFSHYGLQNDSEDFWSFKKGYTEPGLIENRIPLIGPLFKKHKRQPDMIIMGSGLWDAMKWALEDKYALRPPEQTSIQLHQLQRWLERAEMFVDIIQSMFPKAFYMWRFIHYCQVDWWGLEMPNPPDDSDRAQFHESRIYQLNHLYSRLLEKRPDVYRLSWGELLTGHIADAMYDSTHPNKKFASVLWADMVLYYLRQIHK